MDPFASALDCAAAVRKRQATALELVNMYLERIERYNPQLNAFWVLSGELARDQAERPGEGLLAGAPTTVKDLAPMAGFPHTFGSRAYQHNTAQVDHFVVTKMKAGGCPILGRTTTPEFGSRPVTEFGLHGTTRNPWDPSRTCGGSSGGAAAALAAGLCSWSHGSDGGGSVRIPASCCGLVGLKPSRGRISPGPLVGEGWAGLSTQGVLTRTVEDAGAALDVLAGHLPGDPYWAESEGSYLEAARRRPKTLRVGFQVHAESGVDPDIVELVLLTVKTVTELGHEVDEGGPDTRPFREPFDLMVTSGTASYDVSNPALLDPINAAFAERAKAITAADYVKAVNVIRNHSREVIRFWDDHDVLVTPTLTQPPPRHGHFGGDFEYVVHNAWNWLPFTYPYNCTGQPAISLPLGLTARGLPLGVQLVGPPRGEAVILGLAAQLQEAMPWRERRPEGFE